MKILIDLQACQAPSSMNRGIGRYTMSLVKALVGVGKGHEFWILLNEFYATAAAAIKAELPGIPRERFVGFTPPADCGELISGNSRKARAGELLRNALIQQIAPEAVLTCSLFEGAADACAVSIPESSNAVQAVVLYDLIPLMHRGRYLSDPNVERWYMRKFESLRRADLLLGISESATQEAGQTGYFSESQLATISSAIDHTFFFPAEDKQANAPLAAHLGLVKPFVMYTGGIDWRKNIERLIQAYASLPMTLRQEHQLALVCHADDEARQRLIALGQSEGLQHGELVLTGYVSDEDLRALYRACRLFVFPSLHEGFGLPVLEAMACGAPVIGSERSSIPEVIGRGDALFNAESIDDIAAHLERGLVDASWRESLIAHGARQAARFSWNESASLALAAIERAINQKQIAGQRDLERFSNGAKGKPALAMVTPVAPMRSGIADYAMALLGSLATRYDVTVICDMEQVTCQIADGLDLPIRSSDWFQVNHAAFDRVVYQFGNSEFHARMFELLKAVPGVVVLHDFFLSGVLAWMENEGGYPEVFNSALTRSHGHEGLRYLQAQGLWKAVERFPCNSAVIDRALAVIVHSDYSIGMARSMYGSAVARKFRKIPLVRQQSGKPEPLLAKRALGLSEDTFLVCSFGFLGPTKLNDRLIQAWLASKLSKDPHCKLIFVGQNSPDTYGSQIESLIESAPFPEQIKITGFVDKQEFERYLAAADLGVQLRTQSRGETSAAVLDCMAHAVPVLLNANGPMAEYSADEVFRLDDEFELHALVSALEMLHDDFALRERLSAAGLARVSMAHGVSTVVAQYHEVIESAYAGKATADYWTLVDQIAQIFIDAPDETGELAACARALASARSSYLA